MHDFYGMQLMDTSNIRQRVMSEVSDEVEGVTGRWTFFSQIISQSQSKVQISTPVYAVDSSEELKLGLGRLFKPKSKIGEREVIVSAHNLELL